MANIDTLVKELGQLTVLEALDLSKKLSKEWNIDLDAIQAAPAQVAEVVAESTTATVMLTSFADGKKSRSRIGRSRNTKKDFRRSRRNCLIKIIDF